MAEEPPKPADSQLPNNPLSPCPNLSPEQPPREYPLLPPLAIVDAVFSCAGLFGGGGGDVHPDAGVEYQF